jgi:hypothetical protein
MSTKLIVTHRGRLTKRYGAGGLATIDAAVKSLIAKDAARGITSVYLHLDDAAEMKKYKTPAVTGLPAPQKVKKAVDALFAALSPDYLTLLGSGDIIPYFSVPNPSFDPSGLGDLDRRVPTDNPYASSKPYKNNDRASYLVPDRVVGRIPDLPGSKDPSWLLDYLKVAESWTLGTPDDFDDDFMVCCDQWRASGDACVSYVARQKKRLLISPPTTPKVPAKVSKRYGTRFQMIKCHGADKDAGFYGQKGQQFPEVLVSTDLLGKTAKGTVVGAMCCYGGQVFDPNGKGAIKPGLPPISSVYLKQGAYGFFGSTTIAWVGISNMQCADWIVGAALKAAMQGASLGRAMLDSKQGLVDWINKQGRSPDIAEEKTLLQFHLLGDPSIHVVPPVAPSTVVTAGMPRAAGAGPRTMAAAGGGMGPESERRSRREYAHANAEQLRGLLPHRRVIARPRGPGAAPPSGGRAMAGRGVAAAAMQPAATAADTVLAAVVADSAELGLEGFQFGTPLVHEVSRQIAQPELRPRAMAGLALASMGFAPPVVAKEVYEYYYTARRPAENVIDARMVKVETDKEGTVIRTQVLASA